MLGAANSQQSNQVGWTITYTLQCVFYTCIFRFTFYETFLIVALQKCQDETLRWKVPADPADPRDPADRQDQLSSAAGSNHSNTRAGGQDYVSSNQTPSNDYPYFHPGHTVGAVACPENPGIWISDNPTTILYICFTIQRILSSILQIEIASM